jgi:hypothetical protein
LACEAAAFVGGVLDRLPFFGDGASAIPVTAALAAGERSLATGRAVPVELDPEPAAYTGVSAAAT